ncbi:MAG: Eco57I restriction-modification methylase domain-containing protein [Promethearchaeota archaeon]
MKEKPLENHFTCLRNFIERYEKDKLQNQSGKKKNGIVYTPQYIADFITNNVFKIYFGDKIKEMEWLQRCFSGQFDKLSIIDFFNEQEEETKYLVWKHVSQMKILDPSCGSGRFLLSVANFLLELYKILSINLSIDEIKRYIIEHNVYGVEIEKDALLATKARLLIWYFNSDLELRELNTNENINSIIETSQLKFQIFHSDYLLKFNMKPFDIILGNPPYIENKKIEDMEYKNKLKIFDSAYRLYDLSILFIEKSMELLKQNQGYLSFLITNKFLAADYGIKIRKKIVHDTLIKQIIDISSLSVFKTVAAYPIIITLKIKTLTKESSFDFIRLDENLINLDQKKEIWKKISQNLIKKLPVYVIPLSGDNKLVNFIFDNYDSLQKKLQDLTIVYRPFGFIKWAKHFKNIQEEKKNNQDLLIIGTGNLGKYHIKFNKLIRIAKNNFNISYFTFQDEYKDKWKLLQSEKLIFREIAKELTWVYDPGIYVNITGLYQVIIPSFTTNDYFCLLVIMNSKFMNNLFNTLYQSLHMAGGYLRYNGSFIKRLPIPNDFPSSISNIGRINHFLHQLKYEIINLNWHELMMNDIIKLEDIEKLINLFDVLSNALVEELYLQKQECKELNLILNSEEYFPEIEFKYIYPHFDIVNYECYNLNDTKKILGDLLIIYTELIENERLMKIFSFD